MLKLVTVSEASAVTASFNLTREFETDCSNFIQKYSVRVMQFSGKKNGPPGPVFSFTNSQLFQTRLVTGTLD